jgi:teichuronic acid biosynthesis glycosyltransferase TuaC
LRILMMANNFPWPGDPDGIFNLRQCEALRALGHDVRVVRWVPWQPPFRKKWGKYRAIPAEYTYLGFPVRALRAVLGPGSRGIGTFPLQLHARIASEVRRFEPDVVHVHGLLPAGMMGLCSRVPFVLTAHGSETYRLPYARPALRALASRVVRCAAACAAVSDFCAGHLRAFGAAAPSVIFNGADDRTFYPRDRGEARLQLSLDPHRPVVAFAAHMTPAKGTDEMLDAAIRLRDLRPQFIFAGDGSQAPLLRQTLAERGIDAKFPGWVDHATLATVLAACDVLVLPSHAEGLPTLLCEAMNAGRAVVATPVGGIPEIVADGETGYLVPVGDAQTLAARMRTVLCDATLRERFERRAAAFAHERLTWRANARAYDALYHRIVEANGHGHAETRTLTGCPTGT